MRLLWVSVVCLLAGCDGAEPEKDTVPGPSDSLEACGATPPIIQEVRITNEGLYTFGEGMNAQELPAIRISVDVQDEDGNLEFYKLEVFWDTDIDDEVDSSGIPDSEISSTISELECGVRSTTVGMRLAINGNPPTNADMEFGVVVRDASDLPSDDGAAVVVAFHTPDDQGN